MNKKEQIVSLAARLGNAETPEEEIQAINTIKSALDLDDRPFVKELCDLHEHLRITYGNLSHDYETIKNEGLGIDVVVDLKVIAGQRRLIGPILSRLSQFLQNKPPRADEQSHTH